jgi:UDP-3-O-[3-hydroxymyristoyl] glucosamine N-acyltransferase
MVYATPGAPAPVPEVHPTAVIDADAVMAAGARVGAFAVVAAGARVEAGSSIGTHAVIGRGCTVGEGSTIGAGATLYPGVHIGAGSSVGAGCRLGPDGFGFAWDGEGHRKIPQVGGCRIGRRAELAPCVTVDRGSVGDTVVGDDVRLGTLVHVGHNARLGRGVVVEPQAGIAGSAHVEDDVHVGAQVAVMGHLTVGAGVRIERFGGVTQTIEAGARVSGTPARGQRETRRVQGWLRRIPLLLRRLDRLERIVAEARDPRPAGTSDPR